MNVSMYLDAKTSVDLTSNEVVRALRIREDEQDPGIFIMFDCREALDRLIDAASFLRMDWQQTHGFDSDAEYQEHAADAFAAQQEVVDLFDQDATP